MGKQQGTAPGVGAHGLRFWTVGAGSGVSDLQAGQALLVLRLLSTKAPLDATEELRMEWGPVGWI